MEYLYDGWFKVGSRTYNGRVFEYVVDKDASGAIVEDADGKLLLVRQFRPALLRESLEIPAGCLDKPGLGFKEVMVEELAEEAHLDVKAEDLKFLVKFNPVVGMSDSRYFLYYYKYPHVGIDSLNDEDVDVTEILWVSREEFYEKILNGEISDLKSQMAFFYLEYLKNNDLLEEN
ncbi:MAG: NUDIX hydrolase [Fusobacteria bacterium]|nr:NUDIX hydrolase [Fusobacteriota bacterium]